MGEVSDRVAEVTTEELSAITSYREANFTDFVSAQEAVYGLLENYRKGEGRKTVRFVMSRHIVSENPVKAVQSIVHKIYAHRQDLIAEGKDPNDYGLDSIDDWIGIKVLCPYPTDVDQVIEWLLGSGRVAYVKPTDRRIYEEVQGDHDFKDKSFAQQIREAARRDREKKRQKRGYLAWHFMVGTPPYARHLCELQIKTLLEEAWDAKTHDVSYKRIGVKDELKNQMKLLSRALEVADQQSETVKILIEEEETHRQRRRTAAIQQYLWYLQAAGKDKEPDLIGIWKTYQQDGTLTKEDVSSIDEQLRQGPVTAGTCHSRALLAVLTDRADLEVSALECANSFVAAEQKSKDNIRYAQALRVRAISRWALGETGKALVDLETALELEFEDRDLKVTLQSLYAYYVADSKDKGRRGRAFRYLDEDVDVSRATDTRGFLLIVFADGPEDVNEGRRLLLDAINDARKSERYSGDAGMLGYAEAFHQLHDYIAVRRLLDFHQRLV